MTPTLPLPRRETVQVVRDERYTKIQNVYIPMRDGQELCADIFLPSPGKAVKGPPVPCLMSMGPYGKDIHALEWGLPRTDIYSKMHAKIKPLGPDACMEHADPLVWTSEFGYALVRVDVRGIGGSPGIFDPWGISRTRSIDADAEGNDLYDTIEWIAEQEWCNGRVGMTGISYLGMVSWTAAQQRPPSLKAIVPWEAGNDFYSQFARPGGIPNSHFLAHWWKNAVLPYQHGFSEGVPEELLETQRVDFIQLISEAEYRSQGPWPHLDRHRRPEDVEVPLYSAGNWMDTELHSPGNIVGYMRASSTNKYLEMHCGDHLGAYYDRQLVEKQRRFLDYFLLDTDNRMEEPPRVDLLIRKGTKHFRRTEEDFPPPDTLYKRLSFTANGGLTPSPAEAGHSNEILCEYPGLTGKAQFQTEPLQENLEVLGFPYLEAEVSTSAKDMDVFISITNIGPNGRPLTYTGNHHEVTDSVTRGYFRLSHRELDPKYSTKHLPWLLQKSSAPVEAGARYSVKIPIQPTSMIFEKGHRIRVEISARDGESLIPIMQHTSGDRTEERYSGYNRFFKTQIVLPYVKR
ncbi:Alpha/Beta hydrolase protein [Ilyonectria destructans]|nr:Alpha/Beta hydrolase protein [Ilyonectria destructans]